jgi:serine phosphatase RsbU (regulator of sigma subunit)
VKRFGGLIFPLVVVLGCFLLPEKVNADPSLIPSPSGNAFFIEKEDLQNSYRTIFIPDVWKYHAGDNMLWSDPWYDDFLWDEVSTLLGPGDLPFVDWKGYGWFRLTLDVDESLVSVPLAFEILAQSGAAEVYLNGDLLYSLGRFSTDATTEISHHERKPLPLIFTRPGIHVLAVRYSNHKAQVFTDVGLNAGFQYLITDIGHHITSVLALTRRFTTQQYLFTGILTVFSLIHMLLFLFYPKHHQNLYFSLFAASFGLMYFIDYQLMLSGSGLTAISMAEARTVLIVCTLIFFLLFSYRQFYPRIPMQFWVLITPIAAWPLAGPAGFGPVSESLMIWYLSIFLLEIFRVIFVAVYRKKDGAFVFGAGMTLFVISQFLVLAQNTRLIHFDGLLTIDIVSISGLVALLITMSVSMSRSFATTSKRLEDKLIEVQQLSALTLEQERKSKENEIQTLLLQADNQRKTLELEQAREMQLSMLPKNVPKLPDLEIAVLMKTATEVGGDYYDFYHDKNGYLTAAIGDVTGHGTRAGIVVATAKSYFQSFAAARKINDLFSLMSDGVRNMNLRMIYMTLALLRYHKGTLELIGGGMPPALIYSVSKDQVSELSVRGFPLGAPASYPHVHHKVKVFPGDVLMIATDGLLEGFNQEREMLGLERVKETFASCVNKPADGIIEALMKSFGHWTGETELGDDITLMVLKFK